ncbi:MAG TPA: peptidoglycan DD-metalloendopeptidase family protein [Longimicrobiales bacterium]|nr:peptidoglycan DD-metalloendopeptidase family protein [Longimicrobiales bacterium]
MTSFRALVLLSAIGAAVLLPQSARAQEDVRQELRESQRRLEQIRREREQLRAEMAQLQSRVHDLAGQLANIERQISASESALRELDFQAAALASTIESTTQQLLLTRDRLSERNVILNQRIRSIYKRGPMHAARVLLSAESFADLLNRYKYLHLINNYDRKLVREIQQLEAELVHQERELRSDLIQLEALRTARVDELQRLQQLGARQQATLRQFQQRERQAQARLQQIARDEARLTNTIAELERRRLEEERRRVVAGGAPAREGTITTRDLGTLDWPVEGELVYRFGPERRPNGVVLRWNGIGIAAPPGTPVRAVEGGTVVLAGPFEGYGPTVMISHGGGYYTLYLYLGSVSVRVGQEVEKRQVIGTVGGERTPEGPHIEFQVRAPVRGGVPEAVDPLTWLRNRSGS